MVFNAIFVRTDDFVTFSGGSCENIPEGHIWDELQLISRNCLLRINCGGVESKVEQSILLVSFVSVIICEGAEQADLSHVEFEGLQGCDAMIVDNLLRHQHWQGALELRPLLQKHRQIDFCRFSISSREQLLQTDLHLMANARDFVQP